jgi:ATP-dependent Clp protease ATP-binding subunit ClpB
VHHGVRIKDEALIAAATLSDRYITSRFLPDKAIDLVDEAASRLKMEIESQPTELDQVERRILQLNIEKVSLSKENDTASRERSISSTANSPSLRAPRRDEGPKAEREAGSRSPAASRELEQLRIGKPVHPRGRPKTRPPRSIRPNPSSRTH